MTKSEIRIKFNAAIKEDDKATLMEMIGPLLDKLANMIVSGTLIENVKAHLSNNGLKGEAMNMITEMAVIRAENFMHYKAK